MKKQIKLNFITLWRQNDWGFFYRRNEALLWELSQRDMVEGVLHIEHITLKNLLSFCWRWIRSADKQKKKVFVSHIIRSISLIPFPLKNHEKYSLYSVLIWYSGNLYILKKINDFLQRLQYKAVNKYFLKSKLNICLIAYPPLIYLPEAINNLMHDILMADLVDDVLERNEDVSVKKQILANYKKILMKCNWIISTSPDLNRKYEKLANQPIDYLPNGTDVYDKFVFTESEKMINRNGRKLVGYVGNINNTMDLGLLEYIISCLPDTDFILIGPIDKVRRQIIFEFMERYDNLQYPGSCPHSDIFSYLTKFDVLISCKKNGFATSGGDSIKIYDYLATGKPVVSTPVPPADRFSNIIYVASDNFQFVNFLKIALEEDDQFLRKKRMEISAKNTWSMRADVIIDKASTFF